jgi:nudix-type nucleoside diphosphatase (YffH/AdpP family)
MSFSHQLRGSQVLIEDSMDAVIASRERVYDGWYKLDRIELRMPDGQIVERHVEDHGPAAAVLAYDPDRRTALLVSMPRATLLSAGEPLLLEAIAGNLDGRPAEEAARTEALEEAGVRLTELEWIANIWSLPALSTERLQLFLAAYRLADRVAEGGGLAHEAENISVHELPLSDLAGAADAGRLVDAKTLLLLQTLRIRRPELFS